MIYFIRSGNCVKIGVSEQPWQRLADLQTAHHERLEMLAIMPGSYEEERQLHRRFSEYHQFREWFRDNEELRQVVQGVRQVYPDLQTPPRPSTPENVPQAPLVRFSHEVVEKIYEFLSDFRQSGGVVEVFEYPDKYVIGLPDTTYKGGYDPTKLFAVTYDDGQITPKIGREMKPRTLTDRLNEAMMHVLYSIDPPLSQREGYGIYMRFPMPIAPAAPQEPTP